MRTLRYAAFCAAFLLSLGAFADIGAAEKIADEKFNAWRAWFRDVVDLSFVKESDDFKALPDNMEELSKILSAQLFEISFWINRANEERSKALKSVNLDDNAYTYFASQNIFIEKSSDHIHWFFSILLRISPNLIEADDLRAGIILSQDHIGLKKLEHLAWISDFPVPPPHA